MAIPYHSIPQTSKASKKHVNTVNNSFRFIFQYVPNTFLEFNVHFRGCRGLDRGRGKWPSANLPDANPCRPGGWQKDAKDLI